MRKRKIRLLSVVLPLLLIGSPAWAASELCVFACTISQITGVLDQVGMLFMAGVMSHLANIVAILMSLAVVFYGMKFMVGQANTNLRDGTYLLAKIGLVIYFNAHFVYVYQQLSMVAQELITMVTSFVPAGLFHSCSDPGIRTLSGSLVWARLDCVLSSLIGYAAPGVISAGGFLGFLVKCIFSGPIGFFLFMIGVQIVIMLLLALCQAVYIYICAYIGFILLMAISPIFVPMILLRVTRGYFEKWLRLLFGFVLQPMILVAFLWMMLIAIDVAVFSGPRSINATIAAAHVPEKMTTLMDWAINLKPQDAGFANLPGVQDTGVFGQVPGLAQQMINNDNFALDVPVSAMDFTQVDDRTMLQIIFSFISAGIVMYVFHALFKSMPFLAASLSGEFLQTPMLGNVMRQMSGSGIGGLVNMFRLR